MKVTFIAAAMAVSALALPVPSMAGDHGSHPPMGPPLSVICAAKPAGQQFPCLHPSYVAMLAGHGLAITFSSPCGFFHAVTDSHGVKHGVCS